MVALADLVVARQLFADALSSCAVRVRSLGLELEARDDFWELRRIHISNAGSGAKTAPMYDVRNGQIPHDARWFAAVDGEQVVGTSCVRIYDWRGTDGRREIESGRAFSSRPEMQALARCAMPEEAATLTGIVAHDGGMWIAPTWRGARNGGLRLVRLLSEADRFYACLLGVRQVWSIMDEDLVGRGKHRDYGYPNAVGGTAIEWPGLATRWGFMVLKNAAELEADARTAIKEAAALSPARAASA